jgi:ribosomal protein L25 (general stress protein Ctc)
MPSEVSPPAEVGRIEGLKREATGSKLSQWARYNQLIPGVVYGYDERGR